VPSRRDQAFARARTTINSKRFRMLLIDTLQWIESRQSIATDQASMPIRKFAADVLHRRIRNARKDGRDLDKMSPLARHRLRIRVKKIRQERHTQRPRLRDRFPQTIFPRRPETAHSWPKTRTGWPCAAASKSSS
jgi:CHAD domain-containing protein